MPALPGGLHPLLITPQFGCVAVLAQRRMSCSSDSFNASTWPSVIAATARPSQRGCTKPNFYARWQPGGLSEATPLLTLDLVPTGKPGEVRVYFRGQPLGGIKATFRTPDEKEQELVADAEGFLRFKPTPAGQYLLTLAHYREALAGFHGGRAYEQNSHNAALTWRQP